MKELMQGTVIVSEKGHIASKLGTGAGWKVKCTDGKKPWPSTWRFSTTNSMVNIKQVNSKSMARKLLEKLDNGEA